MATEADHIIPESISITKDEESPGIVKILGKISEKEIKTEDAKLAVEGEGNPQCVEKEAEKGSETVTGDQNSEDEGFSGVEDIKPNSTVHEGEVESDLVVKTAPVTYREDDKIITNVEEERQVTEDEIREEKIVKESDDTSIVKCEEGEQGEGTQKTREFSDEENKENVTPEEKVFETASKEQDIEERALREVYTVADAPQDVYVRAEENLDPKESLLQKQIRTTDETSLGAEDINVKAEENLESKHKLEEQIPTAKEEDFLSSKERLEKQITSSNKDAEAENKEPDNDVEGSEEIHKTQEYSEQEKENAFIKAADLSEYREEKNLEEQDIGEVPSSLIAEETTKEIAKEEEILAGLKEAEEETREEVENSDVAPHEEKQIEDVFVQAEENFDPKESLLEKQIPAASDEDVFVQAEESFESIEKLEEKIPIAEDKGVVFLKEAEAENKNKGLAKDIDEVSLETRDIDVNEGETKEKLEEQFPTAENEGETFLKEAEEESNQQDIASEDGNVEGEENVNSQENLKRKIPTTEGEAETSLKEAEAENKGQVKDGEIVPEEKSTATILTDKMEEQIPTAEDESETLLKESEVENKELIKDSDIVVEEKGLATIIADEKALEIEDVGVQVEENFSSEEKLENQIPKAADKGEGLLKGVEAENKEQTESTDIAPEDTDAQGEECFDPKENLEKQIPATADEHETRSKEEDAENKEQVKATDVVHEEKGLETILTDQTSLDVEDVDEQAEESLETKEIPTVADESGTILKEDRVENKERVKDSDIAVEEKGLATIVADEKALEIEDVGVQVEENFSSEEKLENQIPKAADKGEGLLKEAEAENKEQAESTDIAPKDIDTQGEECFDPKENLEKQIPDPADEHETRSKKHDAENKEQVKATDVVHEEKGLETILPDQTSLVVEDVDEQAEESLETKEIPTVADESETLLKEDGVENKERVKDSDNAVAEKGLERSIVADEKGLDIEDVGVQVEENFSSEEKLENRIPKAAEEGETEAENNEQIKNEDVGVQVEESFNSEEKLENQIQKAPEEGETGFKEVEKEHSDEQVKNTDIAHQETVIAATSTDKTTLDIEEVFDEPKITGRDFDSGEILEESQGAGVGETTLKEREAENTEQVISTDAVPEEKDLTEAIFTNETSLDVEDSNVSLKDAEEENKEQVKNIVHESIHVEDEESIESKENLEEKIPKAADEGEVFLNEAEAENKEHIESTDIAHEGIDVQGEESFDAKEKLEKQIPTTADDHETCLKEAEPENKEVHNADIVHEEKGVAAILTDEPSLKVEDLDEKAEESEPKEHLEKEIATAADETETLLKEDVVEQIKDSDIEDQVSKAAEKGETGFKEEVKNDIAPQETVLETISTDHKTTSDIDEGIFNVQEEENLDTKEIPTVADEGEEKTVEQSFQVQSLEEAETKLGVEDEKESKMVEEVFDEPKITGRDFGTGETIEFTKEPEEEILEESQGAGVGETTLKEHEAENTEQVKGTDAVPEEKDLTEAIFTNETSLDVEDSNVSLKDAEEENKEQVKNIVHESIHVEDEENIESKENLDEKIPKAADEGEMFLNEAEAENKEHIKSIDIAHEGIDVQGEESFDAKDKLEKQIPTTADDHETCLKEAEPENKEVNNADIVHEEKGVAAILTDEPSLKVEDLDEKAEESEPKEHLEKEIARAADETETLLKEDVVEQIKDSDIEDQVSISAEKGETGFKEEVKNDIAPQETVLETISTDHKTNSDIDEGIVNVQEEENLDTKEIPTAADEGEEKTAEQSFQVQSLEEVETKLGVEDEKESKMVEEVFDEPKVTGRDFGTGETIEFRQEPIEEETLKESETAGVAGSSSCETSSKDRAAENTEQVKSSDIGPEEKDLTEAIFTNETSLDVEDINVRLKDPEEENKEQEKSIVHEGIHVEDEEKIESKEELEEKIPKAAEEGEEFLKEAEAENKEQIESADIAPEDIDEKVNSQEKLEQKIPTTPDEHETSLKDADIVPEEKGLASILAVEASKGGESLESKEKLEEQIPEAVDEGETLVKEFEEENKEQIKDGDIAVDEKGTETTIVSDEKALDIEEEEGETEAENNEQVKNDVAPQEKILQDSEEKNEDNGAVTVKTSAGENSEEGLPHEPEEPKTESSGENAELVASSKEETTIRQNIKESPENESTEENETKVEEILKESDIAGVGETETQRSEEILETATVKSEEGTNQVDDNDRDEEAFTVKSAKDDDNHVMVTEASAKLVTSKDEEEDSAQELKNYEERAIQNTQEYSDPENKENETAKEEAADLSRNVVDENKKEEASEKVSCSEDTASNENLKEEEENIVSNLKEESEKEPALDEPKSTDGDLNGGQTIEGNATTITPESVQEKTVEILEESQAAGVDESTVVERSEEIVNVTPVKYEEDQPGEETLFQKEEPRELNASELVLEKVEHIDEQEKESLESKENLEEQIPAAAGKEQIKTAEDGHETTLTNPDIVHEEKGLETFLKDETSLEVEDTHVKAVESESKENLEKQTPTEVDESETFLKEDKAENNEQSLEEEETKVEVEDESYKPEDHHHPEKSGMIVEEVQEEAVKKSQENDKEVEPSEEGSGVNIQERNVEETSPEFIKEDGSEKFKDDKKDAVEFEDEIVKEAQTAEKSEEIVDTSQVKCEGGQLGEDNILDSEKAPTVSKSDSQSIDGHEASLNEAEAENKEQVKNTDVVHEEKGVETILTSERSLEVEDIDVKGEESESKENLERQIPTKAADESETLLKEVKAETKEQKGQETVVAHKKALDNEEENFNSEEKLENQNPKASEEGEDKTTDQQSFQVKSLEEAETKVGVEDEILKEAQTAQESEEIVDASQVECEESQLGEGNIPDSDKAATEDEGRDREIFHLKVAEEDGEKKGAVTDSVQASETSLEEEGDREAPVLVPEKLDVDASKDEIIEVSETVPKSDSQQSTDVVSKDEVITYQSLHEKISAEELQIPSATLPPEEIEELKPSQHEDIDVPVDENKGDLFAAKSAEETLFQKEEPRELKASDKLDASETEEEIKEAFETVSKSDSQSIDAVSKDDIIADQPVLETTITEVSIDENEGELFAAKEEPRELKVSELAPEKLDADETKEEIKEAFETVSKSDSQGTDVVSKDEVISYQALHEILVPEENEVKVSESEIGTRTQDKNIEEEHKNEVEVPEENEVKVSESEIGTTTQDKNIEEEHKNAVEIQDDKNLEEALSQKEGHKDVEVSQSGTKETYETTPEFVSQSVDVVTEDEISSSTLLTDKTSDRTSITSTAEATEFPKEELRELKASDFELQISPEVQTGSSSELLEEQGSSLKEVPKVEEEERVDESPDSSNLNFETSDKASDFGITKSQEATISEIHVEANETTKNEVSNEEVHEVHQNGSESGKAEKLVESEDTSATDHIPYELQVEDKELSKGSEPESITEENHQENKATEDEIIEGSGIVPKFDSHESIAVDSKDKIITYQTQLHEDVLAEQIQIRSATLLPEEIKELKPSQHEHETATQDKNAEEECTKEMEVLVAARGEPLELKVSELAPGKLDADETEEETKEISEPVSKSDSQSTDVVSKDESISYQALHEILVPEEEIKVSECELGTTVQDKNIEDEHKHELEIPDDKNMEETLVQKEVPKEVEVSDLALKTVDAKEKPREDEEKERFDDPRSENLDIETSDDKDSDFSQKEGFVKSEDAISHSKAEENQCETPTEENETRKNEASNEEVEGQELRKDYEPESIGEEIHQEHKATDVEDHAEKTNEATNENQNEGIAREKYERQLTFEDIRIKSNDRLFVEDKTTQEQEGTVEDAAFEFDLKNEEDEVKPKTSTTATQAEKGSIAEASQQGSLGFEEANETSQDIKKPKEAYLTEVKDSTANKELQAEKEDGEHEHVEEVKTDEEKGEDEHENSDSPVMVEASKDSDAAKVSSHKKSHNILSGIKHSISKVKKAITGKSSSHSKTQTEK